MNRTARSVKPFVLAMVLAAGLLAACIPSPVTIIDRAIDRTVDRAIDTVAERIATRIVDRLFENLFAGLFADVYGAGRVRYGPDFGLDLFTGSYEATVSGAAPVTGTFSGAPTADDTDPDEHNLSFGIRGVDEDGAEVVMVSLYQIEDATSEFAIVLFEAEDSAEGEGGTFATIVFGSDEEQAYEGTLAWTITSDTPTRLAGTFSATGLVTEAGLGPVDVAGTFDVPINRAGSLIFLRD
ncbi:MAG: hypothetical protein ACNA8N_07990 [Trueperaceae bacterium]